MSVNPTRTTNGALPTTTAGFSCTDTDPRSQLGVSQLPLPPCVLYTLPCERPQCRELPLRAHVPHTCPSLCIIRFSLYNTVEGESNLSDSPLLVNLTVSLLP